MSYLFIADFTREQVWAMEERANPVTSFIWLSRRQARAVLASFALVTTLLAGVTFSPLRSGFADCESRSPGDVQLYRAEVDRIQAGDGYYEAAGRELRSRGYPTRSVFNWRTPLPVWLIGKLPSVRIAQVLLCVLALTLLMAGYELLYREAGLRGGALGLLLMTGAVLPCLLGDLFVMPELWAGVLLALSVVAYGLRRHGWGAGLGLTALYLRELAGPYCVISLLLAIRSRRWRETGVWTIGLVAYGLYFAWHAAQVAAATGPTELAHQQGWIRLGGAGFVISLVQMNAYLLLLPQWVSALVLGLALIGFAGWNTLAGIRAGLTFSAYLALFAIIGQPFNQYWGCLITPLICLGVGQAPAALGNLWFASGWRLVRKAPALS